MIEPVRRRRIHEEDQSETAPPLRAPAALPNIRAQAVVVSTPPSVHARIDSLRDDFSGPYVVDGQTVRAPVMFRMMMSNEKEVAANAAELNRAAKSCGVDGSFIRSGQAPAKLVVTVTRKLIEMGHLPPPPPDDAASRIRTMQWRFGVGADCASYTRQAFERATGRRVADLGVDPGFRTLDGNPHFKKVGITDVRTGDIITLDPHPPETIGHNLIVCDHTLVSDVQMADVIRRFGDPARAYFSSAGPFHVIEVDSSWGAGRFGDTTFGGQRRELWLFDEATKKWSRILLGDRSVFGNDRPVATDDFHGAYRVR